VARLDKIDDVPFRAGGSGSYKYGGTVTCFGEKGSGVLYEGKGSRHVAVQFGG